MESSTQSGKGVCDREKEVIEEEAKIMSRPFVKEICDSQTENQ